MLQRLVVSAEVFETPSNEVGGSDIVRVEFKDLLVDGERLLTQSQRRCALP
jgi:hypothetical protein